MEHTSRIVLSGILVALFTCSLLVRAATPADSGNPNVQLEPNSCAIQCPADASGYPGKSGGVSCVAGSSPVCQCHDAKQKLAYCAVLPTKQ